MCVNVSFIFSLAQFEPRSSTFPVLPCALPGTRPLTCQERGGEFKGKRTQRERGRKKSPNHGRDSAVLLVWQVLSPCAQCRGRKAEKRAETQISAHLHTSPVPHTEYGEFTFFLCAFTFAPFSSPSLSLSRSLTQSGAEALNQLIGVFFFFFSFFATFRHTVVLESHSMKSLTRRCFSFN